jgi:hypothetical protein
MALVNAPRVVSTATLFTALIAWSGSFAEAACIDIWARSLKAPHNKTSQKSEFRLNEQFVVCLWLSEDAFVSVWDQPPNGNPSRLFPNVITHKSENPTVRAGKLRGDTEHCFGTPETFPLFFPANQGQGGGTLSVFATASLDGQPTLEDYYIPGDRIQRDRMDQIAKGYRMGGNVCANKDKAYFEYRITK